METMSIVLLLVAVLATPTRSTHIRFKALDCQAEDPAFAVVQSCIMKPIGRDVKDISIVVKLLQTPVTNITIRAEIMRRGFFKPPLYTFNVDGCRFLESENRNPVANALYKFMRFDMYSNMNHTCPFDHDIILDHMRLDETFYLPLPIGLGEFTIKSYWHAYNVLRAKVNINIEII